MELSRLFGFTTVVTVAAPAVIPPRCGSIADFRREPSFARFLSRLASYFRLILFDKRGTGLSDRVPLDQLPSVEQRMDDVRAVMEAVGSKRAALCGVSEGGRCAASSPPHTRR